MGGFSFGPPKRGEDRFKAGQTRRPRSDVASGTTETVGVKVEGAGAGVRLRSEAARGATEAGGGEGSSGCVETI
jgi:hypothetical protein